MCGKTQSYILVCNSVHCDMKHNQEGVSLALPHSLFERILIKCVPTWYKLAIYKKRLEGKRVGGS
jgi:hypothetical protein